MDEINRGMGGGGEITPQANVDSFCPQWENLIYVFLNRLFRANGFRLTKLKSLMEVKQICLPLNVNFPYLQWILVIMTWKGVQQQDTWYLFPTTKFIKASKLWH